MLQKFSCCCQIIQEYIFVKLSLSLQLQQLYRLNRIASEQVAALVLSGTTVSLAIIPVVCISAFIDSVFPNVKEENVSISPVLGINISPRHWLAAVRNLAEQRVGKQQHLGGTT